MAHKFALSIFVSSFLAASVASAAPPQHAEAPKSVDAARPNSKELTPKEKARFDGLVRAGDRARATGHPGFALFNYAEALSILADPVVSGRLGLVYASIDMPDFDAPAAIALYEAVWRGAGANRLEQQEFSESYINILSRVCRLDLTTSHVDAELDFNESGSYIKSNGQSWTFMNRGKHTIRGRLKGYDPIEKLIECKDHEAIALHFEFVAIPDSAPPPPMPLPNPPAKTIIIRETSEVKLSPPVVANQEPGKLSIGIGPAMVAGAAPSMSLGGALSASYRRDNISGIAGVRGVWALGDVNKAPVDIFTLTGLGGPCTHVRWFAACALASVNAFYHKVSHEDPKGEEANSQLIPGLGIGVIGELPIKHKLGLRISGDVTVLSRDIIIDNISPEGTATIWHGGRFVAGVSAMVVF